MEIEFTMEVFKEGRVFVAYAPKLDVSSCGDTRQRAEKNLLEAVRLFVEEAEKMGTLDRILDEAGFVRRKQKLEGPRFIRVRRVSLPLAHAKA